MTAKEYLSQARELDRRINLDLEKLSAMRSSLYGRSARLDGDGAERPRGNSIEAAIQRVIDYEARIDAEIDLLMEKRLEIEKAVEAVPDTVQREILTRRYLLYQKWEVIAVGMGLDLRWVYRLHGRALEKIDH